MATELKRIQLRRVDIAVEKTREIDLERSRKYRKIVSSINNIGIIEPLSVYAEGETYTLLDGYLRLKAAEELGLEEVPCFVYRSRDSYTFNAMRNELSPLQESRMLKKAISQGVDEKDLAAVLNVQVTRIRESTRLADNLVPKAKELLESNCIQRKTAEQLRRVNEERQLAILNNMEEAGNYNASLAKVLVMKTPEDMMRNLRPIRTVNPDASKKRLYTQIKKGDEEIEFYAQRYKDNMKELMKQVVFFRTLLERESTAGYLNQAYTQIVQDVQKILTRSETEVLS